MAGFLKSIEVPNSAGSLVNVVLGFDRLDRYINESLYFGAVEEVAAHYIKLVGGEIIHRTARLIRPNR